MEPEKVKSDPSRPSSQQPTSSSEAPPPHGVTTSLNSTIWEPGVQAHGPVGDTSQHSTAVWKPQEGIVGLRDKTL